jgi:hypothetical protein
MEIWTEVRRRVLTGEFSKRAACQEYGLNWRTLEKMLSHVEPPGYRRQAKREQKPRSHDNSRIAWAKLMALVGEGFPLLCPARGGDIRLIALHPSPARSTRS